MLDMNILFCPAQNQEKKTIMEGESKKKKKKVRHKTKKEKRPI